MKADLKPTVQGQLTELTQLLDQEGPDLVAAANQVEALETILEDAHNYEPLTQTRPEEGVRDLILEKPELLIEAEEIPFESQTRENKNLAKGESRILQAGKVGRRLKLIEVRQEEGKEIRTEVDAFVEVEAQDQITEVGTKEAEVRSSQKLQLFLKQKTKKKKKDPFSCNRKPQKQFLFWLQTIRKKKMLKVLLYNRKENFLKPVQKKVDCLLG